MNLRCTVFKINLNTRCARKKCKATISPENTRVEIKPQKTPYAAIIVRISIAVEVMSKLLSYTFIALCFFAIGFN